MLKGGEMTKVKWETIQVRSGEEEGYLREGWEPFGVITHHGSYRFLNTSERRMQTELTNTDYIHLRRRKTNSSKE